MKAYTKYFLLLSAVIYVAGCAALTSAKPLKLSPYRRNIVIRQDASVLIENETIDFRKLQSELSKRAFVDKDRIMLHTHQDVPPQVFDAVYEALIKLGYQNIEPTVYSDKKK